MSRRRKRQDTKTADDDEGDMMNSISSTDVIAINMPQQKKRQQQPSVGDHPTSRIQINFLQTMSRMFRQQSQLMSQHAQALDSLLRDSSNTDPLNALVADNNTTTAAAMTSLQEEPFVDTNALALVAFTPTKSNHDFPENAVLPTTDSDDLLLVVSKTKRRNVEASIHNSPTTRNASSPNSYSSSSMDSKHSASSPSVSSKLNRTPSVTKKNQSSTERTWTSKSLLETKKEQNDTNPTSSSTLQATTTTSIPESLHIRDIRQLGKQIKVLHSKEKGTIKKMNHF